MSVRLFVGGVWDGRSVDVNQSIIEVPVEDMPCTTHVYRKRTVGCTEFQYQVMVWDGLTGDWVGRVLNMYPEAKRYVERSGRGVNPYLQAGKEMTR